MISCKGCGANMHFDPAKQMLKCDYCGNLEDADNLKAQIEATDMEMFDTTMFSCPQCGATLFSDDDTAATFCSYCGSSVIIEGRAVKMKAPSYVIPFKKTRENAVETYEKFIKGALYAPNYMKADKEIEKLRGIYMPYWIYEMGLEGPVNSSGHTSRRSGDYIYTSNYRITSQVRSHCNGTSFDASSSFSDELSQSIAPYNFRDSKAFSAGYLSGFYVDSADVESNVYETEAKEAFAEDIAERLRKNRVYSTYNSTINSCDIATQVKVQDKQMAYFPVWFIANEHKGYVSYAVINGQTGKISADVPIDYGKYIVGSLIMALPIMGVLCLLTLGNSAFMLRPIHLAIATIFFALISLIISNKQLNLLYTRLLYLDDKGLRSVRNQDLPPEVKAQENKQNSFRTSVKTPANPLSTVATILLVVCGTLVSMGGSLNGALAAFAIFGLFIGIILRVVISVSGKSKLSMTNASVRVRNNKVVYKMPTSQKIKITIKPIIAMSLAVILIFVNPFIDSVYYGCVFALMGLVLFTYKDIVDVHNKLTRRLPRQFGKRGGDENEI